MRHTDRPISNEMNVSPCLPVHLPCSPRKHGNSKPNVMGEMSAVWTAAQRHRREAGEHESALRVGPVEDAATPIQ